MPMLSINGIGQIARVRIHIPAVFVVCSGHHKVLVLSEQLIASLVQFHAERHRRGGEAVDVVVPEPELAGQVPKAGPVVLPASVEARVERRHSPLKNRSASAVGCLVTVDFQRALVVWPDGVDSVSPHPGHQKSSTISD